MKKEKMKAEKTAENRITTYKAFDKDFKCKSFQFEVGIGYKHDGKVEVCRSGFHSCVNPFDVFNYYPLIESRFAEVEIWGNQDKNTDDSKIASEYISIKKELTIKEMNLICIDFLIKECKSENQSGDNQKIAGSGYYQKIAGSGDYQQIAGSGYYQKIAGSGDNQKIAGGGDNQKIAGSGDNQKIAGSGYYQQIAGSGYNQQIAGSGDNQKIAGSGYYQKIAGSGYYQQIAGSGDNQQIEIFGKNSVGANIGYNGMIKGIIGTWITLAEYNDNICVCVQSAQIDGKKIKENVFYQLVNGNFKEVK